MDIRPITAKLITILTIAAFGLSACGAPTTKPTTANTTTSSPASDLEKELRKQATAMQRTILEGALAGVALGGGLGFALNNKKGAKRGAQIGLFAGLSAGTYVAFVQRKYSNKQKRLRVIKSDLDKNAKQMQTTINVMRGVLAVQRQELAAVKSRLAAGKATKADVKAEIGQARANLSQMQKAINGASARQAEFGGTRGLTVRAGVSRIDGELAALTQQIAAMKAIANDLASEI